MRYVTLVRTNLTRLDYMPSRNVIKINITNGYYHVYNRGVEKRIIFEDAQDYKVFLNYLKEYLSPPPSLEERIKPFILKGSSFQGIPHLPKNYFNQLELLAFCLMPNHFHLLIKQKGKGVMANFMRSLATRYSMYFNKKYSRVGPLFQGIYKAVMITNNNHLLHLTRYIHLNPLEQSSDLISAYSSYGTYLGIIKTPWISTMEVLSFFGQSKADFFKDINTYKAFVENHKVNTTSVLGELTIENDDS